MFVFLSPLLIGCAGNNVSLQPQLPDTPADITLCDRGDVALPEGDWTAVQTTQIIGKYRVREKELRSCYERFKALYGGLQQGLAKQ